MAMGADRGILIKTDQMVDSDLASRLLAEIFRRDEYGLIILGKQSIDSDANQCAQLLAERLGLPQACFASKLVLEADRALVTREVDGGLETLSVPVPCVVSTDLRLNEPRYAPLPGIMKAKKKPLDEIDPSALGVDMSNRVEIVRVCEPPARKAGRKVESVDELLSALQNEAKVL
jgi:electron transfer flavoprotein beta subunit